MIQKGSVTGPHRLVAGLVNGAWHGFSYATWDAANRPVAITANGITETYRYDGDGNRITRTRQGQTTVYFQGLWEDTLGVNGRKLYRFNGQIVAIRDDAGAVTYPHGDHLGSVSVVTDGNGSLAPNGKQEFDPWGSVRAGGITSTSLNYTGQQRDDTGLLFYNARYYDPVIARFVSADSIAPQLTNPQTRNRYAYVLNNPLNFTDPTGHCGQPTDTVEETKACGQVTTDLAAYDITIADLVGGIWASNQLGFVLAAVVKLRDELFAGSIETFRAKIGVVNMYQSAKHGEAAWFSGAKDASAITGPGGWGSSNITFYQQSFSSVDFFQRTVVHELGHAWDIHSLGNAARDLRLATGSGWINGAYRVKGVTTKYGGSTDREDWAEAVAETVYSPPSTGGTGIDKDREKVVRKRAN